MRGKPLPYAGSVSRVVGRFERGMPARLRSLDFGEGIAIGIGLGSVISYNIVQEIGKEIEGLKFAVPWVNVIAIVAISWVFAMVTTYWPARQASRIYPSEALRYE